MPLDFKEAVGEDGSSKEHFCEVQKDQVQKFALIKTNIIQSDMQIQTI